LICAMRWMVLAFVVFQACSTEMAAYAAASDEEMLDSRTLQQVDNAMAIALVDAAIQAVCTYENEMVNCSIFNNLSGLDGGVVVLQYNTSCDVSLLSDTSTIIDETNGVFDLRQTASLGGPEICSCQVQVTPGVNTTDDNIPIPVQVCDCSICPTSFGPNFIAIDCTKSTSIDPSFDPNNYVVGTCGKYDCDFQCDGTCFDDCFQPDAASCTLCPDATMAPSISSAPSGFMDTPNTSNPNDANNPNNCAITENGFGCAYETTLNGNQGTSTLIGYIVTCPSYDSEIGFDFRMTSGCTCEVSLTFENGNTNNGCSCSVCTSGFGDNELAISCPNDSFIIDDCSSLDCTYSCTQQCFDSCTTSSIETCDICTMSNDTALMTISPSMAPNASTPTNETTTTLSPTPLLENTSPNTTDMLTTFSPSAVLTSETGEDAGTTSGATTYSIATRIITSLWVLVSFFIISVN
jgi:hypothetical protein